MKRKLAAAIILATLAALTAAPPGDEYSGVDGYGGYERADYIITD
jgi:hypothetical protein